MEPSFSSTFMPISSGELTEPRPYMDGIYCRTHSQQVVCLPSITKTNIKEKLIEIITILGVEHVWIDKEYGLHTYWMLNYEIFEKVFNIFINENGEIILEIYDGYNRSFELPRIVNYYLQYFKIIPNTQSINFDTMKTLDMMIYEPRIRSLSPVIRDPELVRKEIHNVFQHAHTQYVDIAISYIISTVQIISHHEDSMQAFLEFPNYVNILFDIMKQALVLDCTYHGDIIPREKRHEQVGMMRAFQDDTSRCAVSIMLTLMNKSEDIRHTVHSQITKEHIIMLKELATITSEYIPYMKRDVTRLLAIIKQ
jgi:hypothetical protein